MEASTILIVATLLLAAFVTYKMFARETGFRIMSPTQDGKPRFAVPEWIMRRLKTSLSSDKNESGINAEEATMFAYIALTVVSALAAKFIGYTSAGVIALIGVHIIWLKYGKGTGVITKVVIYGMLTFFVLAWLYPEDAFKIRNSGIKTFGNIVAWAGNTVESLAGGKEVSTQQAFPQEQPQTMEAPIESFKLTSEWLGPFTYPPSGGAIKFECLNSGAELKINFVSAKNPIVTPGQIVPCPTPGQGIAYAEMFIGASYYFRSENGGDLRIQGATHSPI